MAFEIENNWDAAYVEYSVDHGKKWNKLGDANDPNWYNSSLVGDGNSTGLLCTGAQWEGIDSIYKILTKYYRSLAPVKGESNLLIRIVMSSDHFLSYDGMVVDDIKIYDAADSSKSPQANFSAITIESCEGDSIEFIDESLFTPTSWLWSFKGGSIGSDTTQYPVISYDSSGTYDVTLIVFNALGSDTITKSAYIAVNENPSVLIGITDVACYGDTTGYIDLNVTEGTPPYYYWWSNGQISQDLSDVAAGNYYVTVRDVKDCNVLKTATVNEPDEMLMTWQKKDVLCEDSVGYISVIATGGTNSFSYWWSNGVTDSIITGLTAGLYYVAIGDGNKCSIEDTITILQLSTNLILSKTDVDCYGENIGSVTVEVADNSPPYSYFWSNSDSSSFIDSLYAGTYIVSVINSDNCLNIDSITILQPESISVDVILNDISCKGFNDGSISVSVYGGVSPYEYVWSNGDSVPDLLNLPPGNYILTVIDNNDCSKNRNYNIDEPDTLDVLATVTNILCYGDSSGSIKIYTSGGTTPYQYFWSNGDTIDSLSNLKFGSYTITITDDNKCISTKSDSVAQPQNLALLITDFISSTCLDEKTGLIETRAIGGVSPYIFIWSNGDSTSNIKELDAGYYSLTVIDANSCLKIADSFAVINHPEMSLFIKATDAITGNNNGTATVSVGSGAIPVAYLWDDSLAQTTSVATGLASGNYKVIVTSEFGCQDTLTAIIGTVDYISELNNFGIQIYPNPNSGKFVVEFANFRKKSIEIQILSIDGRILYSKRLPNHQSEFKKELSLKNSSKGVFILKVVSDDVVLYRKIVYQ
ncbi:MAG: T9SS type A sorting domain-containing protein [Bacteroidia bacterium]|nr:T9SS type A sorting domain-containing protein [Bacteroidia bacterium]